jgi:hypothetical protein
VEVRAALDANLHGPHRRRREAPPLHAQVPSSSSPALCS